MKKWIMNGFTSTGQASVINGGLLYRLAPSSVCMIITIINLHNCNDETSNCSTMLREKRHMNGWGI